MGREVGDIRRCLSGRSDHSLTDALFIPYRELKSRQRKYGSCASDGIDACVQTANLVRERKAREGGRGSHDAGLLLASHANCGHHPHWN